MKRLLVALAFMCSATLHAATFTITNVNDSGPGSLRWAIEQSNATPGADTINGTAPGGTIALASALPAIRDRVSVSLYNYRIDGTNAGDADGLVINAANVSISFLRVANFKGDGLVLLGGYAQVSDVISTGNRNGIRIDASNSSVVGIESLSNRANGIWVTSTGGGNQMGQAEYLCTQLCPYSPPPDEVSGNALAGIRIDGDNNRVDSVWIGVGAHYFAGALPNGGDGITVNGAQNTVIFCTISNNEGYGVQFLQPARFLNNDGSCNKRGFVGGLLTEPPVITSARADPAVIALSGIVHGIPDTIYRIDFLGIPTSCPSSSDLRAGTIGVTTDASGLATWTTLLHYYPLASLVAIAIRDDIEVSHPSEPFPVFISGEHRADLSIRTTGPSSARTGQTIEFVTEITNNGPAAVGAIRLTIPRVPGASFVSTTLNLKADCYLDGLEYCGIGPLAIGETTSIVERVRITATGGTLNYLATVSHYYPSPMTDPNPANNSSTVTVPVVFDASNIPATSPLLQLLLGVVLSLIAFVSMRVD